MEKDGKSQNLEKITNFTGKSKEKQNNFGEKIKNFTSNQEKFNEILGGKKPIFSPEKQTEIANFCKKWEKKFCPKIKKELRKSKI